MIENNRFPMFWRGALRRDRMGCGHNENCWFIGVLGHSQGEGLAQGSVGGALCAAIFSPEPVESLSRRTAPLPQRTRLKIEKGFTPS